MNREKDICDKFFEFAKKHLDDLLSKGMVTSAGWGKDEHEVDIDEYITVDLKKGASIEGLPSEYKGIKIVYKIESQ